MNSNVHGSYGLVSLAVLSLISICSTLFVCLFVCLFRLAAVSAHLAAGLILVVQ